MKYKILKTFTLIEMLIVIVIIGILAAALVPRLQSIQGRARDSKRKVDLRSIHQALEIYKTDYSVYPLPLNSRVTTGDYSTVPVGQERAVVSNHPQAWLSGMSQYITTLPVDPINTGNMDGTHYAFGGWGFPPYLTGNYTYMYSYLMNQGTTYDLTAQLENKQDPDRSEIRGYRYRYTSTGLYALWFSTYPMIAIYEFSPDSNSY